MYRVPLIAIGLSLLPLLVQAQRIAGGCFDVQQRPITYATVTLLSLPDSLALQATSTDKDGQFELNAPHLPAADYVLLVSMLGYHTIRQRLAITAASQVVNIPTLTLSGAQQALGEVVVEGRPPLMEVRGDKLIMNVASSPTQSGLNGLELMSRVPGVLVNRSTQQITLRNRSPLIMIDGRPTYLTTDQLAQRLKTMRSDEVATIEIVQNPSARYEAAGSAGIINIRTKQSQRYGSFYTLQLEGAYGYFGSLGSTPRHNESLNYSHRGRKLAVFASVDNGDTQLVDKAVEGQTLLAAGQVVEQRNNLYESRLRQRVQRITTNAEWYLTPRTTVSLQAQRALNSEQTDQQIQQVFYRQRDSTGLLTGLNRETNFRYWTVNAQLQQRFDSIGRQLTVGLDWTRVQNDANSNFAFRQYKLNDSNSMQSITNFISNPFTNPIYAGTVDYVQPTARGQQWEAGAKVSITENKNFFSTDFVRNVRQDNYFDFKETISALYGQWSGKLFTSQLQAGLRAEQTYATGSDEHGANLVRRSYLNVFPSVSLTKSLTTKHQFTLAYSRRIERPSYYRYNPFQRFSNRFEYTQGNPLLNPAITNTFSLRHVFKDAIVTTLSYDRVVVEYSSFFSLDSLTNPGQTLIRTSWVNTSPRLVAWYNANGTVPIDPTKWLHLDISYWYTYQVYRNEVQGLDINFTASSFGANLVASVTLPKGLILEMSSYAQSGNPMGAFERSWPQAQVNFGLRKALNNKRGTLKLNLNDPFNLYAYRSRTASPDLLAASWSRGTNRFLNVLFTYQLGNDKARTNSRASSTQDIRRRARAAP